MATLIMISEAGRILNVSAGTVRLLADAGKLPNLRTSNGTWLFKLSDIEELARVRREAKH